MSKKRIKNRPTCTLWRRYDTIWREIGEFNLNVLRESCLARKMSRNFHTRYKTTNLYSGFGDAVNCEDTWKACSAYIDEQFRQYFTDESGLNRKNIQDNRVHCCLYFIPPYGHGYIRASIYIWHCIASSVPLLPPFLLRRLRQIDLEVLKRLHRKVNVVPVIAKADTLTTYEVKMLKDRILADIEEHEIQVVSVVPVIFLLFNEPAC